jgi:NitT/TauT family transport system permease protein
MTGILAVFIWSTLWQLGFLNRSVFPSPLAVAQALRSESQSGRLWKDLIVSLYRLVAGFSLAAFLGIAIGLWLGTRSTLRAALLPLMNLARCISPLAWIPFAILWFGIGDAPVIFLVFIATFFPLAVATISSVASIPANYFRVATDFEIAGFQLLTKVMLPATLPQVITALRVSAGIAWVVIVAAEMIAGRDGLGFAIWDARNGLRMDLLVAEMAVIGSLGVISDWLLLRLTTFSSVRWGYEH